MAHLPPLATPADGVTYGYPGLSEAMLLRASTRVRRYTGQEITLGSSTVVLNGVGPWLLPQRPVQDILTVTDDKGQDAAYELKGQHLHSRVCAPLTVVYTHGYDPLSDELVELVCGIADRLGGMPRAVGAGARTEQAGGETVTWGVEAFISASGLTAGEEAALDRLFPKRPRTTILL